MLKKTILLRYNYIDKDNEEINELLDELEKDIRDLEIKCHHQQSALEMIKSATYKAREGEISYETALTLLEFISNIATSGKQTCSTTATI